MDAQNIFNPYQDLTQDELNERLIAASEEGNDDEIKALLAANADVNTTDNYGFSVLMYASLNGHVDTAIFLLEKGANVNSIDNYGDTALKCASSKGHTTIVNALIQKGTNVNATDNNGSTALMCAASNGHTATVNALIQQDANVNAADNYGETALVLSVSYDSPHSHTAYRLLSEMAPKERLDFSSLNHRYNAIFMQFNQELKNNANKLYNILMPSLMIGPNSIFRVCPPELINYIKILETLVQDFPDWYQHRIESDLNLTIEFCFNHKKTPPIIFSENAPGSKKRKTEDELKGPEGKKLKTPDRHDDSDDEMEAETSYSYIP